MPPLIGIDGRGLFQKNPTGVAKAFTHIYKNLTDIEPMLNYLIWNNQWRKSTALSADNVMNTRIPNIFLHYSLWSFLPRPTLNFLTKNLFKTEPKAWWLPNIAQVRFQPKTKYLLTLHDLSFIINPKWYPLRKQLWHKMLRLKTLLKDATYIVCVSNEVKQSALEIFKVPEKKLFVGHLAPTSFVVPTHSSVIPLKNEIQTDTITQNSELKTHNYFLHFSSTIKRKNTDGVIAAYKIYRKLTAKPKDLLLVGDYCLKEKIPGIISLPYQDDNNMSILYQNAFTLLYPSWYEGFGLPILEAQNFNVPVITSALGSLPEVAAKSALYAQPWDIEGLAKLMRELEQNETWQNLLKNEGQKNLTRFSWLKTAQLYHYLFWEMFKK